jgi:hypothetical protein
MGSNNHELSLNELKRCVNNDEGFETFEKILEECKKYYKVVFCKSELSYPYIDATAYYGKAVRIKIGKSLSWHDISSILIHEHGHMIENKYLDKHYENLTCLCEARAWENGIKHFSKLKILPRIDALHRSILLSVSSYLSNFCEERDIGYDELKYLHDFVTHNMILKPINNI